MDEDWDVDKYYNVFEPDEQWEMKRKFMETYKSDYPEQRVVCLAQVLVNVEFLGTRYPLATMKTIAELSQGIIEEFRERQKSRLQRTFVGGDDSAKQKAKRKAGFLSDTSNTQTDTKSGTVSICKSQTEVVEVEVEVVSKKKKKKMKIDNVEIVTEVNIETSTEVSSKQKRKSEDGVEQVNSPKESDVIESELSEGPPKKKKKKKKTVETVQEDSVKETEPVEKTKKKMKTVEIVQEDSVKETEPIEKTKKKKKNSDVSEESQACESIEAETGCTFFNYHIPKFVILENEWKEQTASGIFHESANQSKVKVEWILNDNEEANIWETTLILDGVSVLKASAQRSQKKRKDAAIAAALKAFRLTQYQIIITDSTLTSLKDFLLVTEDGAPPRSNPGPLVTVSTVTANVASNDQLPDSNIGLKMLKGMGWTGGGLGAQQQGIVEPITSDTVVGRSGLGYDGSAEGFRESARSYLRKYITSQSAGQLIFSSEFSIEQRGKIHQIARSLGLFSKSSGNGPHRHLVVHRSAPQFRPLIDFAQQLMQSPSTDPLFNQLRVIPPSSC